MGLCVFPAHAGKFAFIGETWCVTNIARTHGCFRKGERLWMGFPMAIAIPPPRCRSAARRHGRADGRGWTDQRQPVRGLCPPVPVVGARGMAWGFLPSHSPDFNPIGMVLSKLKTICGGLSAQARIRLTQTPRYRRHGPTFLHAQAGLRQNRGWHGSSWPFPVPGVVAAGRRQREEPLPLPAHRA